MQPGHVLAAPLCMGKSVAAPTARVRPRWAFPRRGRRRRVGGAIHSLRVADTRTPVHYRMPVDPQFYIFEFALNDSLHRA